MYDWDDPPLVNTHREPAVGPSIIPGIRGDVEMRPDSLPGQAACVGVDPDLFFPGKGDWRSAHLAIRICKSCPIMAWCKDTHLWETYGIWGGTNAQDRRELRKPKPRGTRRV